MNEFLDNDKKINCKACGSENNAVNTFCMNCGERIEKPAEHPEAIERADAEVVASTPWYNESSADGNSQPNPYANTGTKSAYQAPPTYVSDEGGAVKTGSSGLAIASLVCGIVSLVCCYLGFFVSIGGLITGIMSLVKKQSGRGMAIAGIVTSAISFLFWGFIILAVVAFSAMESPFMNSDWEYFLNGL